MPVGRLVRTGLVGGIVVIYVALVGLLAKVAEINLIGDAGDRRACRARCSSPFLVAYVAVRPRVVAGEIVTATTRSAATSGAVAGLAAGGSVAIALLFTNWYGVDRVGEIFIQVNPALLEILSFGKSVTVGAVILTVGRRAGRSRAAARSARWRCRCGGRWRRRPPSPCSPASCSGSSRSRWCSSGSRWTGSTVPRPAGSPGSARRCSSPGRCCAPGPGRAVGRPRAPPCARWSASSPAPASSSLLVVVGVLATIPLLLGAVISEVLGTVMVFMLLGLGLNIVVGYAGLARPRVRRVLRVRRVRHGAAHRRDAEHHDRFGRAGVQHGPELLRRDPDRRAARRRASAC